MHHCNVPASVYQVGLQHSLLVNKLNSRKHILLSSWICFRMYVYEYELESRRSYGISVLSVDSMLFYHSIQYWYYSQYLYFLTGKDYSGPRFEFPKIWNILLLSRLPTGKCKMSDCERENFLRKKISRCELGVPADFRGHDRSPRSKYEIFDFRTEEALML